MENDRLFDLHKALGKAQGEAEFERARANTASAILRIQREKNRELRRLLRRQSRTNHPL